VPLTRGISGHTGKLQAAKVRIARMRPSTRTLAVRNARFASADWKVRFAFRLQVRCRTAGQLAAPECTSCAEEQANALLTTWGAKNIAAAFQGHTTRLQAAKVQIARMRTSTRTLAVRNARFASADWKVRFAFRLQVRCRTAGQLAAPECTSCAEEHANALLTTWGAKNVAAAFQGHTTRLQAAKVQIARMRPSTRTLAVRNARFASADWKVRFAFRLQVRCRTAGQLAAPECT
jgi:hypothetical protein